MNIYTYGSTMKDTGKIEYFYNNGYKELTRGKFFGFTWFYRTDYCAVLEY